MSNKPMKMLPWTKVIRVFRHCPKVANENISHLSVEGDVL